MLQRYLDIEPHLRHIDVEGLDDILLCSDELDDSRALCNKLKALDTFTVKLQDPTTTLADARTLFDAVIAKHPFLQDQLSAKERIFRNWDSQGSKYERGQSFRRREE